MCRENPQHKDLSVIVGKVWLIGRSYSASIERKAGPKMVEGENFYLTQVAPKIKSSQIDRWISTVAHIERVTQENLHAVLVCHKKVTDLLKEISGVEKRSLASKYLHFHVPGAFFIYDSLAQKAITSLCSPIPGPINDVTVDRSYAAFCRRCLALRETIEKHGRRQVTNRELDVYLLST
ncbi:hypothetical protein KKD52_17870 [Myxococcota bacterium]|nr:hypothetical protein [Myxococcota bacterium]